MYLLNRNSLHKLLRCSGTSVHVRLQTQNQLWSWYIISARYLPESNDYELYCLIDGDYTELGTVWLGELEEISSSSLGMSIKRDEEWIPKPLDEVMSSLGKRCA